MSLSVFSHSARSVFISDFSLSSRTTWNVKELYNVLFKSVNGFQRNFLAWWPTWSCHLDNICIH